MPAAASVAPIFSSFAIFASPVHGIFVVGAIFVAVVVNGGDLLQVEGGGAEASPWRCGTVPHMAPTETEQETARKVSGGGKEDGRRTGGFRKKFGFPS